MNRKLHNSLTALTACSLVLIPALLLALMVSPLLRSGLHETDGTAPSPSDVAKAAPETASDRFDAAAEQPAPSMTRRRRDSHQSLVMPFFSFAPRG